MRMGEFIHFILQFTKVAIKYRMSQWAQVIRDRKMKLDRCIAAYQLFLPTGAM